MSCSPSDPTVTLTFDSSPIKGEGELLTVIADLIRNPEGRMGCLAFTLTFDSSPVKGEGNDAVHRFVDSRFRGE